MSGKDRMRVATWFDLEVDRRREGAATTRNASSYQAIRPKDFQHGQRGHFFSNRVVKDYNSLPDCVKQATDINIFKNLLDTHRGTPSMNHSRPTVNLLTSGHSDRGTS